MELGDVIRQTAERIADYRASVADRSVAAAVDLDAVRERLDANWTTNESDIEQSVAAIDRILRAER
jgi:hypothetical protein